MKYLTYLIVSPMILLAVFPPIEFNIRVFDSGVWTWAVLISGFMGLYTWFLKINPWIKAFTTYAFISCFFSSGPYISFTSYTLLVLCVYYYALCLKITDWTIARNALIVILALNILMLSMQYFGKDYLCNFGSAAKSNLHYGTVGNPMRLSGLLILISGFLMAFLNEGRQKTTKYALCIGLILYVIIQQFIRRDIFMYFPMVRGPVWLETIKLTGERPLFGIFGWGMGMFKVIFDAIANLPRSARIEGAWFQAHNCFLQAFFEMGFIGITIILCFLTGLFRRLIESKLFFCVLGLAFVCLNVFYHSPTRDSQDVLMLACFLAFLEKEISCQPRKSE